MAITLGKLLRHGSRSVLEEVAREDVAMQAWIATELRTVCLEDERLERRYALLLDRLSEKPSLSIPAACRGFAETTAAYRFFDNERVTVANILEPHQDASLVRIREHEVVLIPQDTTEIDLTRKAEKVGGPLSDAHRWGGVRSYIAGAHAGASALRGGGC